MASTESIGQSRVNRSITVAAPSTRCSQLSTTRSVLSLPSIAATALRTSGTVCTPSCRAMTSMMSAGSVTLASSTNQTAPNDSVSSTADCTASRVLPTPPTPIRVTMRCRATSPTILATSLRRPTSDERGTGRLLASRPKLRTELKRCRNDGWSTCHTRSASAIPRSRCVPRSASGVAAGPDRARRAATSDSRI